MKAVLVSLAAMLLLSGCATLNQRTSAIGFYRAHIDAPVSEALLLWVDKEGRFKLVTIPDTEDSVEGSLNLASSEEGRWRVFWGTLKMKTVTRTWAPHLPKATSYAELEGAVLRWRGIVFTREEEEEPNQSAQTTPRGCAPLRV